LVIFYDALVPILFNFIGDETGATLAAIKKRNSKPEYSIVHFLKILITKMNYVKRRSSSPIRP